MSSSQSAAHIQALWPADPPGSRSVWAVLDCARDPVIRRALLDSRLEFRCLYSGPLHPSLEAVAPQLVELLPGHRLTQRLLGDGFGQAWGVFLRIDDASNLRHHLRKFLKVRDESGRRLLFRWYDPRVMRSYLPTCTAAELATVFGPIHSWLVENETGDALVEYSVIAGRLSQRTLA